MKWKCPKCGREFSRRDQDHYCMKPQTIDEYALSDLSDALFEITTTPEDIDDDTATSSE